MLNVELGHLTGVRCHAQFLRNRGEEKREGRRGMEKEGGMGQEGSGGEGDGEERTERRGIG